MRLHPHQGRTRPNSAKTPEAIPRAARSGRTAWRCRREGQRRRSRPPRVRQGRAPHRRRSARVPDMARHRHIAGREGKHEQGHEMKVAGMPAPLPSMKAIGIAPLKPVRGAAAEITMKVTAISPSEFFLSGWSPRHSCHRLLLLLVPLHGLFVRVVSSLPAREMLSASGQEVVDQRRVPVGRLCQRDNPRLGKILLQGNGADDPAIGRRGRAGPLRHDGVAEALPDHAPHHCE